MANTDFRVVSNIDVEDILLDVQNARIRAGADQNDCIRRILRKRDQLLALSESIAKEGLTTMPILATPNTDGTFTVKDGNRRITALKLLNNPQSCPDSDLVSRFTKIAETHKLFPCKVSLTVTDNEQAMIREVLSRHQGEMAGVGQMGWSTYLRTLYLLNHDHPAEYKRPGQYALWAEEQGINVDDDFPISNLQRFFSLDNLHLLGFDVNTSDELVVKLPKPTVLQMTTKVIGDFGSGKSVNEVFTPDQARKYIDEVRALAGLQAPAPTPSNTSTSQSSTTTGTPSSPAATSQTGGSGVQPPIAPPPPIRPSTPRPAPTPATPSADRKKVFGSQAPSIAIPTTGYPKEQTIVTELRKLDMTQTPLAAAMLLRALIELSDGHYRDTNTLPDQQFLAKNIKKSAQHMLTQGKLTQSQNDIVERLCNPSGTMIEIEALQKMMHRSTHNLNRQFVNTLWDNIGCFVRACWP